MTGESVYAVPVLIELVKVFNRLQNITSLAAEESKANSRRHTQAMGIYITWFKLRDALHMS